MFDDLEKLTEEKKIYDEKIKETGEKAVKSAIRNFTEKYSEVEGIRWEQYTPYFNDGESCLFSVGEIRIRLGAMPSDAGDYSDGYMDVTDFKRWYEKNSALDAAVFGPERYKELTTDFKKFVHLMGSNDDALEAAFGDHVKITVTNGKIVVDDYEHD